MLMNLKIVIGEGDMIMDTTTKYVDFDPCTSVVQENMAVSLCNSGRLLSVSICLKNVCPDRSIMVGVLVCYNNRPYALKTKEVSTQPSYQCCPGHCCCCCCNNILVEGFEFIFPFEACRQKLTIKVVAHYIC